MILIRICFAYSNGVKYLFLVDDTLLDVSINLLNGVITKGEDSSISKELRVLISSRKLIC